jgi:ATP/maltotriose-dependent transcriptional regulator MalT
MSAIKKAMRNGQHSGAVYSLEVQGKTRWFELSVAAKGPLKSTDRHFVALVRDITDRKESENELRRTTQELKAERKALTEKNITLKQILDHIATEKKGFRRRLSRELQQAIKPHLAKLQSQDSAPRRLVEALEGAITAILEKESEGFEERFAKLTPREKKICNMIQEGLSSKEISERLVVSPATIHKHREQIRKKLGITNKGINLSSYLVSSLTDRRTQ